MTVSVVIPVYNEQALLERCLKSLAAQTAHIDEIIIVDNNCTDDSVAVARSFGAKIVKQDIQGIMPATYAGMMAASSDIIARCDADSVLPPDWVATIKEQFESRPDAVALTGPGEFYDTNRLTKFMARVFYMSAYFWLAGSALASWPLFGSNCAIRRTKWLAIQADLHRDRADIHDDMEISLHIPASDEVIYLPRLVVGISARSLSLAGMRGRIGKGFRTLKLHWPDQSPKRRWQVRWNV